MPTPDHEALKSDVATALRDLERTLERFIATLSHQGALASAEGGSTGPAALRRICDAYATINYDSADEPNDSPVCLGVVGANAAALAQAHDLNEAKARLRDQLKVLRPFRVRVPVKDGQGGRVVKSLPLVRVILRELQRSDLNLLAAYRKIPCSPAASAAWSTPARSPAPCTARHAPRSPRCSRPPAASPSPTIAFDSRSCPPARPTSRW
jgi:hypothetical protein